MKKARRKAILMQQRISAPQWFAEGRGIRLAFYNAGFPPNHEQGVIMKITELLLAELDREAVGIRKTLERIPEGKNDWKPHPKSMPLGPLSTIVATIPAWLEMVVNMDELDINPPGGPKFKPQEWKTRRDLLEQFEASLKKGREVLKKTTDDHLFNTKWRMLNAGKLMSEQTRYEAVRDGVLNHMAHHRGQLTVYLRLNEEKVPAIYGPSADEGKG
jgi:uncharacterized damage-inducible protein DinB